MLTRFLCRNDVEVVTRGYTGKQQSQTARKGCHHIIDILKLCSDVSSRALLSICFITELQSHDSLFTVENLQKLQFKI